MCARRLECNQQLSAAYCHNRRAAATLVTLTLTLYIFVTKVAAARRLCTCTLTVAPCAYGVSLLSTGATILLAQVVVVTSCKLRWWCFILQPLAQIVHLHTWWLTLCNLRWWCFFIHPLVQVLHLHSGSCIMWKWRIYIYNIIYIYIYNTPLAHVVVSPIAACAGGVFPYTHWRRYTYMIIYCLHNISATRQLL